MKPASPIHLLERDYFLELRTPSWPPADLRLLRPTSSSAQQAKKESRDWVADRWARGNAPDGGYLWRKIWKHSPETSKRTLFEAIVRFPSAPLFGSQRKRDYQVRLTPVHQHTFRLLTSKPPGSRRIQRIFLLFNGLNEIDHLGLYYDIASLLIENPNIACLIPPYPGHLTRYPMLGRYAEKPLQRFITDPSDLFRQYLRFMVEMQWLLSVLTPVSYYPVTPGIGLLAEDSDPLGGRCDLDRLSAEIESSWQAIQESSLRLIEPNVRELRRNGGEVHRQGIRQSIAVTRHLIRWQPFEQPLSDSTPVDSLPAPRLHVIGYSLGGYLAQSVFFTWPFAVASCTTLCSGGALHDIRPVKLVHEEEWQAITHGLNYELESGMLEMRLRIDPKASKPGGSVCGIPTSYFSSHFRIFNDVFLQDRHGSYRARVSEFAPRLLFVVGGNDPIVTTRSVLEASPREGINMIEIANLSHFIAKEGGEWTGFWLPTIAKIISSLSERTEALLAKSIFSNLWNEETTGPARGEDWPRVSTGHPGSHVESDLRHDPEPLDSERMQQMLVELIQPLEGKGGFLFILRNQVPAVLMGNHILHRRGSVPHYEDFRIRDFWQRLKERRESMVRCADRITLVVPGRLNEWFVKQSSILSLKSLPLAREIPGRNSLEKIWEDFLADWENETGALHRFDPELRANLASDFFKLESLVRKETATPENHPVLNCLPDIWIGLSQQVVQNTAGKATGRESIHLGFTNFVASLYTQRRNKDDLKNDLEKLDEWLETGAMRVVRISPARSNPRFLGERIRSRGSAIDLLVHTALALPRSTPCVDRGDFAAGWGQTA